MTVTLMIAAISLAGQRMDLGFGSYGEFPKPQGGMPGTADGRHYASLHELGVSPAHPHLPAPVVRGDHLRLVVPYVPARQARHLAACAEGNTSAEKTAAEAKRRQVLLECFGRLHRLTLDGRPLERLPDWYTDPTRDLRGLVFMVPVHDLPRGRHELGITPPDPRLSSSEEEDAPPPDRLPFWR